MSLFIEGIGTATPPHAVTQPRAAALAERLGPETDDQRRQLRAIYRLSHIKTRHSVLLESSGLEEAPRQTFFPARASATDRGPSTIERMRRYETEAGPLTVAAAAAALADARRDAAEISHVITVSCTGFVAPGFDVNLIRQLGLSTSTSRTHIGFMGCHGAFHAMRVAKAFADASPDACVLVCALELCTLHFQYGWSPDLTVANALFADGCGAVVASGRSRGDVAGWEVAANGSVCLDDTLDEMTWRIGNNGFEMTLSSRVPGLIQKSLRPWLDDWLHAQGLSLEAVAAWAVHPGGPRILESCAQVLGTTRQDHLESHEVLAAFGNMSSPTILFILDRVRRRQIPRPCVALGFGPGLSVEAMLLR
jgi:predicted naringenin-chalcone synthase